MAKNDKKSKGRKKTKSHKQRRGPAPSGHKKIAIVYRPDRPEAFEQAQKLADWLAERKIVVVTRPNKTVVSNKKQAENIKNLDELDLVIVLGGDGTYLHAVHMLEGRQVPILGVNLGSLGFLTSTKINRMLESVIYTLEGKMELRPRAMLKIVVKGKNSRKEFLALNDFVIERGSSSQLISVELFHEQFLVSQIKADGLVIATPTGSTAYNLAAGGPIVHPEVSCIVVTPISPHSLTTRPMVFPDDRPVTLSLVSPSTSAQLSADGQVIHKLKADEEVTVGRHEKVHYVVRHPTHNYFDLLREKLKFGQRD